MLTSKNLYGNWATLLLATDNHGGIDYDKLSDEIDFIISAGCNGIYSNGTAGEFYAQTEDEFVRVSELLATKCRAAGMLFQIGVSHMSAQISLMRLRAIKELRPSAVQVILPDWFPVTLPEAIDFMSGMQDEAPDIPLVLYNPPHAKVKLSPAEWATIKKSVPALIGVKVFDNGRDPQWYADMREHRGDLSVFVPGHHLATGVTLGAQGAYSNVACINPSAAQRWWDMMGSDIDAAMELEGRINLFMQKCIHPFISEQRYPNHACDRFMALVGGWADVGEKLRWPYRSIPVGEVGRVRREGHNIIPEFI